MYIDSTNGSCCKLFITQTNAAVGCSIMSSSSVHYHRLYYYLSNVVYDTWHGQQIPLLDRLLMTETSTRLFIILYSSSLSHVSVRAPQSIFERGAHSNGPLFTHFFFFFFSSSFSRQQHITYRNLKVNSSPCLVSIQMSCGGGGAMI